MLTWLLLQFHIASLIWLLSLTGWLLVLAFPSLLVLGSTLYGLRHVMNSKHLRSSIFSIIRDDMAMILSTLKRIAQYAYRPLHRSGQFLRKSKIMHRTVSVSFALCLCIGCFYGGRRYQAPKSFDVGFDAGRIFENESLRSNRGHLESMFILDRPTPWQVIYTLPATGLTVLRADICQDYEAAPVDIKAGMVVCMDFFDRGDCISLNPHLGAWYSIKKDREGNYVRLASAE